MNELNTYTAFENHKRLGQGPLGEIVLKVKKRFEKSRESTFLIFSDTTGKSMDFNLEGNDQAVLKRLEIYVQESEPNPQVGPGRPKLGVISREISLLPRHWEWLATQQGGASVTLRKLVEEAKKKSQETPDPKKAQEATYKFMSVIAGDFQNYEEALRYLYRSDKKSFKSKIESWPPDIVDHIMDLAKPVFR